MVEEIKAMAALYVGRIILGVIVWFVGKRIIRLIIEIMERRMGKLEVDQSLRSFLTPLVRITLQILLVLTVAATLGIEITTFAAIAGAASLAIGLAFQGSLANFAGGVLILALKPFKVGDFIQAGGFSGTVREIQVFYTVLQTIENQKVIIPNADLSNCSAINYTAFPTRRTNFKLVITYDSSVTKAKDVIMQIAQNHPKILKEPEPMVVMGEYGEHGAVLYIRVWANSSDYWTMYFELLELIKEGLSKAEVKIAHHQLDVHMQTQN